MQDSECIIAVNKSETAPIFEIADYGICGDLFKVTPMLIEAIKAAKLPSKSFLCWTLHPAPVWEQGVLFAGKVRIRWRDEPALGDFFLQNAGFCIKKPA